MAKCTDLHIFLCWVTAPSRKFKHAGDISECSKWPFFTFSASFVLLFYRQTKYRLIFNDITATASFAWKVRMDIRDLGPDQLWWKKHPSEKQQPKFVHFPLLFCCTNIQNKHSGLNIWKCNHRDQTKFSMSFTFSLHFQEHHSSRKKIPFSPHLTNVQNTTHRSKARFIEGDPQVSVPCLYPFSHQYFSQKAQQQCLAVGSSPVMHKQWIANRHIVPRWEEHSCFLTSSAEVQVAQTT